MVLWVIKNSIGGEIFVPKIPSFKIFDLAKIIAPKAKIKTIGIRKGEKINEDLITISDAQSTYNIGKYYVIISSSDAKSIKNYKSKYKVFKKVNENFYYNSKDNKDFLKGSSLVKYLKKFYYLEFILMLDVVKNPKKNILDFIINSSSNKTICKKIFIFK